MNVSLTRIRSTANGALGRLGRRLFPLTREQITETPAQPARCDAVSRNIEQALVELGSCSVGKLLIYGDEPFRKQVPHDVAAEVHWVCSDFSSLQQGAAAPGSLQLARFDAALVGGPNVRTDYPHLLQEMKRQSAAFPVFWVADGFARCSGTLPIIRQVDDAELYLYHHFQEFFSIKDPVLARVDVIDARQRRTEWKVLAANEVVCFQLSELLPQRLGPAAVLVDVTHPELTRGRHMRWRWWADLYCGNSMASLHGAHDPRPASAANQFRIERGAREPTTLVITIPNYKVDLDAEQAVVEFSGSSAPSSRHRRDPGCPLEQIEIDTQKECASDRPGEVVRCRYTGCGTSYWFALADGPGGLNLAANHTAGGPFEPPNDVHPRPAELVRTLESSGLALSPHPVPVLDWSDEIEFGFCFDAAWPVLTRFQLHYFDRQGVHVARRKLERNKPGYCFCDEMLELVEVADRPRVGLILVCPDWLASDLSPLGTWQNGSLVARHRRTGDTDVTELQSCWRNLGMLVSQFPHWLRPSMHQLGRTNLYGRVSRNGNVRSALLLINGSGRLDYQTPAEVQVVLKNAVGREDSRYLQVAPMGCVCRWLDELFPSLPAQLGGDAGSLIVRSAAADCNGHILSTFQGRSVALQHMWGY